MKKVLVILGPTATGKTDISLNLARRFNGELVSCDSRQVYTGLDIGSGKMPGKKNRNEEFRIKKGEGFWEIDGIKVWMYDVADPGIRYTVADYVEQANKIIEDILQREKLPIIVGGTGLYLKALLEGLSNLNIPMDLKLRKEFEGLNLQELQKKLLTLSPAKWDSLNNSEKNNPRRLLRSIELIYMNPYKRTIDKRQGINNKYDVLKIGLIVPRKVLNKRIDSRLISRIDQGLIEEGKKLICQGLSFERMRELGLEYGLLADLLEGKMTKDQFVEVLKIKIHQFAKRQMTWFRKEKDITWFDISVVGVYDQVEKTVSTWYYETNDATY